MRRRNAAIYILSSVILMYTIVTLFAHKVEAFQNQEAAESVINCYDQSRGIVQKTLMHECKGVIVSDEKAAKIRQKAKAQRLDQFRDKAPPRNRGDTRTGSGFFVTASGHLITAKHVVEGCNEVSIAFPDGSRRAAAVVAVAPAADLALLLAPYKPSAVISVPRDSFAVYQGQVTAVGYPNLGRTAIRPIHVEGQYLGRRTVEKDRPPVLLFRGRVHPGNSGGPLLDEEGQLLGVVVAMVDTGSVFERTGSVVRDVAFAEELSTVTNLLRLADLHALTRSTPVQDAEKAVVQVRCTAE